MFRPALRRFLREELLNLVRKELNLAVGDENRRQRLLALCAYREEANAAAGGFHASDNNLEPREALEFHRDSLRLREFGPGGRGANLRWVQRAAPPVDFAPSILKFSVKLGELLLQEFAVFGSVDGR
jgi:hypothetical protein